MADEAAFSITKQFHTVRGDTLAEFQQNVEALLGAGSFDTIAASYRDAFGVAVSEQQAVATVQAAFPGAQPVSTVGQPLPQPGQVAQPASVAVVPPGLIYPGDCPHGARVYSDKPARGKPWRRWECHTPWSKETAQSRCRPVNVD